MSLQTQSITARASLNPQHNFHATQAHPSRASIVPNFAGPARPVCGGRCQPSTTLVWRAPPAASTPRRSTAANAQGNSLRATHAKQPSRPKPRGNTNFFCPKRATSGHDSRPTFRTNALPRPLRWHKTRGCKVFSLSGPSWCVEGLASGFLWGCLVS
jgi:hypothetical protein